MFDKKNKAPKNTITSSHTTTTNKKYSYAKNDVHLDFTLDIKKKQELSDFSDLLEGARNEVIKDLEQL